ncbi:Smad nuclear-interacting protein 1 [Tyrophagus putrescentiae]|nr:Smad nuclear-interacting protein 1 [Tyrophagus putrescentiae]
MDRHRSRDDRHDRDHHRHHHHRGDDDSSREKNYSLGELKERARREMHQEHRSSSGSRDYHQQQQHHRSRGDHGRRPSRSRSPSNRYRNNSSSHTSHSPNRNRSYNDHRGRQREDNDHPRQNFNRHRNPEQSEQSFRSSNPKNPAEGTEEEPEGPPPEIRPNFELTGALAKDTNTFNGVLVKYHEPAEAKKPRKRWRFYPFKGDTPLEFIALHRQSAYLFGRDRRVADVPVDHPSCSKQHAVLQFRSVEVTKADGTAGRATRPYIIDLDSGNGTYVNGKAGGSTAYVLLHDESQDDEEGEEEDEEAVV